MDSRTPRDGRVIEELGTYDPMVRETDARAILNSERIDYWLGVGAQPTPKVSVLIKKYGTEGTHLESQQKALDKLSGLKAMAIEQATSDAKKAAAGKPVETPEPAEAESATEDGNAEEAVAESETTESADAGGEASTEENTES